MIKFLAPLPGGTLAALIATYVLEAGAAGGGARKR